MNEPMLFSRRKALAISAAAVAAAQTGGILADSAKDDAEMQIFEGLIGETFTMRRGSVTTKLQLTEVNQPNTTQNAPNARKPFSIILKGDDHHFESGLCEITHKALGTHPLFVNRVGQNDAANSVEFEVVFA